MTRRIARSRAVLAGVTSALLGLSLSLATPAFAASGGVELDVNGSGYTSNPADPLVNVSNLVPGSTASGVVGVWNTTSNPASISLRMTDPNPVTPGALQNALVFTLSDSTDSGTTYSTIFSGSSTDLEKGVQVIASLPANSKELVKLSALLPLGAGNASQGKTFTFGVAVTLTGPDLGGQIVPVPQSSSPSEPTNSTSSSGSASVGGVSTSRAPGGGGSTATIPPPPNSGTSPQSTQLASTGVDIALFTLIGLLLVLCGILLITRRRHARRTLTDPLLRPWLEPRAADTDHDADDPLQIPAPAAPPRNQRASAGAADRARHSVVVAPESVKSGDLRKCRVRPSW